MTMISLAVLTAVLAGLAAYQRFRLPDTPIVQPPPVVSPDREASAVVEPVDVPKASESQSARYLTAPLAGTHKVLRSYASVDEAYGDFRLYAGVAYQATAGVSVFAAGAGTVLEVIEHHPLDGGVVVVDHGSGLTTRYAGLGKIVVGKNAGVQVGTLIGQIGPPGLARTALGSHLQFQVLRNGEPEDPTTHFAN